MGKYITLCLLLAVGCRNAPKIAPKLMGVSGQVPTLIGGMDDAGRPHVFNTNQLGQVLASGSMGLAQGSSQTPMLVGGTDDGGLPHVFLTDQAGNLVVSGAAGGGSGGGGLGTDGGCILVGGNLICGKQIEADGGVIARTITVYGASVDAGTAARWTVLGNEVVQGSDTIGTIDAGQEKVRSLFVLGPENLEGISSFDAGICATLTALSSVTAPTLAATTLISAAGASEAIGFLDGGAEKLNSLVVTTTINGQTFIVGSSVNAAGGAVYVGFADAGAIKTRGETVTGLETVNGILDFDAGFCAQETVTTTLQAGQVTMLGGLNSGAKMCWGCDRAGSTCGFGYGACFNGPGNNDGGFLDTNGAFYGGPASLSVVRNSAEVELYVSASSNLYCNTTQCTIVGLPIEGLKYYDGGAPPTAVQRKHVEGFGVMTSATSLTLSYVAGGGTIFSGNTICHCDNVSLSLNTLPPNTCAGGQGSVVIGWATATTGVVQYSCDGF